MNAPLGAITRRRLVVQATSYRFFQKFERSLYRHFCINQGKIYNLSKAFWKLFWMRPITFSYLKPFRSFNLKKMSDSASFQIDFFSSLRDHCIVISGWVWTKSLGFLKLFKSSLVWGLQHFSSFNHLAVVLQRKWKVPPYETISISEVVFWYFSTQISK